MNNMGLKLASRDPNLTLSDHSGKTYIVKSAWRYSKIFDVPADKASNNIDDLKTTLYHSLMEERLFCHLEFLSLMKLLISLNYIGFLNCTQKYTNNVTLWAQPSAQRSPVHRF